MSGRAGAFRWALADWWDGYGMALCITVGCLAVVLGLAFGINALAGPRSCAAATSGLHMASDWSFWGGCRVQTASMGWIPLENLRVAAAEANP